MEAQTMEKSKKRKSNLGRGQIGSVKIADDVVAMIGALAAMEVDGVSCMAGGVRADAIGRISRSRLSRCVKVFVNLSQVRVDLSVMLNYGFNIPATCSTVQTKVKTAIENMTGLKVSGVNVRIAEITMPQSADKDE